MPKAAAILLTAALVCTAHQSLAQDRAHGDHEVAQAPSPGADQPERQGKGRWQGKRQPKQERVGSAVEEQKPGQSAAERADAAFIRGRYGMAERLYRRMLAQHEKGGGEGGPPLGLILTRLGASVAEQGRGAEAEPLLRRALVESEKETSGESPLVAHCLMNLGSALRRQGRLGEAEPLLRRGLEMRERLQPDSPELAAALNNMAALKRAQRQFVEAEALLRRGLAIREAKLGPEHPFVALSLNSLAMSLRAQGRAEEAEALMQRALAILEKRLGPWNPRLATTLNAQGMLKVTARDYAAAEALFRRAAEIRERSLGAQHPETAQALGNLALALSRQQKADEALAVIRRATAIARARRADDEQRHDEGAESERRSARWLFTRHVGIAHQLFREAPPERRPELTAEAFEMAQWAHAGGVAGALQRMSARFASGSGTLAALVRERQDALARRQSLDRGLVDALSKPLAERDAAEEEGTRVEIAALDQRLATLDQALARDFPAYLELASTRSLKLSRTKQLLAPDEALLIYLIRDDDAFVWAVRRERTLWRRLKGSRESLDRAVKALRARLNPAENREFLPMPLEQAFELYQDLLSPVEDALAGARHLIVVPDGPVQSLPYNVLITGPPPAAGGDPDYRAAAWLARRNGVSVLPSVTSLQALRVTAAAAGKREPFAGFGDPALGGVGAAPVPRGSGPAVTRGFVSKTQILQHLEPLPESARELNELARHLRAPPGRVWTRDEATETKVKSTDLSRFRVLAFATHGLMAGEFLEFTEPSLVLTPPAAGTPDDDGLLTASEVAQLKLDADWVILSACNTAAPDATPGAEGLSGLAKAFFYAGARSLLVSNWYVASDAAVKLTTGAVAALDREPGIGRAEALRRSMLALLDDPKTPRQMTHPMFWAPFVLVGEGGAGR